MSLPRRHTVQHCGDPVAASVTCHPFTARWPPTTSRHRPSKLSHKAEGSWPGVCRAGARRHPGTRTLQLGSWLPRGPSAHHPGPGAGGAIPREAAPPVVRPQASPQGHVRTPSSQRFWGDSCADGGSGPGGGSQQGPRKLQSIFPGGLGDGWHTATHGASPAPLYPEVSRGGQGF